MTTIAPGSMPRAAQVSAIDRLRSFPAIFRGVDLTVRHGWTSKQASQYVWLWARRGLIRPLGGHSDVFFNLVADPHPDTEAGLLLARPSAVIVGIECLRRAGWTTQIPQRPEVAIRARRTLQKFTSDLFEVETRPDPWFEQVAGATVPVDRSNKGRVAPALRPAWALADMLAGKGWPQREHSLGTPSSAGCGLDPDDIDWDVVDASDRRDWARATAAFGVSLDLAPRLLFGE